MIDLFYSYRRPFADIATWIGYEAGTRADQYKSNYVHRSGYDDAVNVEFVDNDFEDPSVDLLFDIVEKTDASYVVLPDIFSEEEVDDVLELGKRFCSSGVTPMVVPKCDIDFDRVPDGWIMAYSVSSEYGSTDVSLSQLGDHDIHLLGGSPMNQFAVAERIVDAGLSINSVDTNGFGAAANYGSVVNYPDELIGNGNAWLYDVDEYEDWSGRVVTSLVHYYEAWRLWSDRTLN